tara:strand:- start:850 stop:1503 length:654 start_codon:yes stop_codon:yes gene_type:complete
MQKKFLFIIAVIFSWYELATAGEWEEISRAGGVMVWKKEIPGSDFIAFKGRMLMDLPISKVASVLLNEDIAQKKRWIDRVDKFEVLSRDDVKGVSVTYSSYSLPFPIADRDFVIQATKVVNKGAGIKLRMRSVKHPRFPDSKSAGVRGLVMGSSFELLPRGAKTDVIVTIQSDPKGMLPAWLVNLINKSWPYNTLQAIAKEGKAAEKHAETLQVFAH